MIKTPCNSLSLAFSKAFPTFVHKLDSIPSSCVQVNVELDLILEVIVCNKRRLSPLLFVAAAAHALTVNANPTNSMAFEVLLIIPMIHYYSLYETK
jgi:hypothetical protein